MLKLYLTIALSLLCFIDIQAQKLNVENFVAKSNDITARTQPRKDINGNDCALVKVRLAAGNASFSGNVVGNVAYDKSEYFVYMPHGSKRLTIKLEGYLPLDVNFEEFGINTLEGKTVYVMTIAGVTGTQQLEAPKTKTGWIILDSEPSGASVYINDEFVGNTPLNNYKQAYGTYQYRLEHPNYHSSSGTINLNAGRYENKIVMKPAFGLVAVKSNVVGAEVLLDGKTTGKKTPCTLSEVASGRHTITLRLNKYAPQQQEVTVEDGQTAQVSVSMDARFASVTINSLQGAQIYCNGKVIGTGRCTEDMMEGYYDLEARQAHHKPVTKQIQVIAGQSQDITLNPTPKYGSLDVITDPHNAMVTIDGKKIGETPLSVEHLIEGDHQIVISLDGYTSETRNVTVAENQTLSVEIVLEKNNIKDMTLKELRAKLNEFTENSKGLSDFLELQKSAAHQGNEIAQNNLGKIYENGLGVPRDYREAIKWYRKAAEQGHSDAQATLGVYYVLGYGVTKDVQEAFKWYKLSAEQGNKRGQYGLGMSYHYGYGIKIDYSEALKWYLLAADQGYREAYNQIGVMYYDGLGVIKSYVEAAKWFTKGAEQGHIIAQENLGTMYEIGLGVPKNNAEAVKWYRKAAAQGSSNAKKALERLGK